jgi:hypothetical protein
MQQQIYYRCDHTAYLKLPQRMPIILFKLFQTLSNWLLILDRFSGLAKDLKVDLSQNYNSPLRNTHVVLGRQLRRRFGLVF